MHAKQIPLQAQSREGVGYWPKPGVADLNVEWTQSAEAIGARVRACNPAYGGAIVYFRGMPVRLFQVSGQAPNGAPEAQPGTVVVADAEQGIRVCCGDGELLHLDIVYSNDGFFTGNRLAALMDIRVGDTFTPPPS